MSVLLWWLVSQSEVSCIHNNVKSAILNQVKLWFLVIWNMLWYLDYFLWFSMVHRVKYVRAVLRHYLWHYPRNKFVCVILVRRVNLVHGMFMMCLCQMIAWTISPLLFTIFHTMEWKCFSEILPLLTILLIISFFIHHKILTKHAHKNTSWLLSKEFFWY